MPAPAERPGPEALLAHGEFVRALARRLVGDGDTADDLAQEAWLAALRRPPRGAWRPWLAAVVRNRARAAARGEAGRRARELRVRTPEPEPSSADVLQREEARARVVAAVLALPPPLRQVVLLRYYEELAPRAIAKQLDLPLETVRTRLKRGLARLRERLAREDAGWRRALLPIAFSPPVLGGLPLAAPAGVAAGLLGVVAAGALLARLEVAPAQPVELVAAAAVRAPREQEEPRSLAAPPARPATERPAVAAAPPPVAARPEPPAPAAAVPTSLAVRGTVVGPFGAPVVDAVVFRGGVGRLRGPGLFGAFDLERVWDGVRTLRDGTFELPGPPGVVTAWHPRFSAQTLDLADADPAEEHQVQLPPAGRLSGTLPAFVKGVRAGERLLLDEEQPVWLDRHLGFDVDPLPAGLHGLRLPGGSWLGLRVRPGETTVVDPGAFLEDVEIVFEHARPSASRYFMRPQTALVGLEDVFAILAPRARRDVLSAPWLVRGAYLVVDEEGPVTRVDLEHARGRAVVERLEVALSTRERPGAVPVPDDVDEVAQTMVAGHLAGRAKDRKGRFLVPPETCAVVRYVDSEQLPPALQRLGSLHPEPEDFTSRTWREP